MYKIISNSSKRLFVFITTVVLTMSVCSANSLDPEMTVTLESNQGEMIDIGRINFKPADAGYEYTLSLDDEKFSDEFLSMRPFKCMKKSGLMICQMKYPYANEKIISDENLLSLEYDLLFLHKTPEEYGIDAWNGLYYKMNITDGRIEGVLHEVDLNVLAAPPEKGVIRPVTYNMLYLADPNVHWFPKLTIH